MLTGNKGEWSEIYTLLKIISDKNLFAGDSNLDKISSYFFPILKVIREESAGIFEYSYSDDIVIIKGGQEEFRISIRDFQEQSVLLLDRIKSSSNATFSIPEIEEFINSFKCTSLKAKSSVKSDIRIVIHDQRNGISPELGFSIKSQLGGASTLLNAGNTTNFVYKITGVNLNDQQIEEINSIETRSKVKDRIERIKAYSGNLNFVDTESNIFSNNLVLIDSLLPQILSEIILLFYTSEYSKTKVLLDQINVLNPLGFNQGSEHPFYEYKIKRFLTDVALGMMPSKVWRGDLEATGGYLIVKEDGEVLCYHIYNRNEFEDYLIANTKLETASTTRHEFGTVYEIGDEQFFKLNLQVRFIK